jgi:hypothetical protein
MLTQKGLTPWILAVAFGAAAFAIPQFILNRDPGLIAPLGAAALGFVLGAGALTRLIIRFLPWVMAAAFGAVTFFGFFLFYSTDASVLLFAAIAASIGFAIGKLVRHRIAPNPGDRRDLRQPGGPV